MPGPEDSARARLSSAAAALFHADGIDARAGVARKSLYSNFASKVDLVNPYLEDRHADQVHEHGFRGCGLLNAAAELRAGDRGRTAVRRHKEEVEALLSAPLADLLPGDPARAALVARHLAFLLEGAITRAGPEGNDACIRDARAIALAVVEGV